MTDTWQLFTEDEYYNYLYSNSESGVPEMSVCKVDKSHPLYEENLKIIAKAKETYLGLKLIAAQIQSEIDSRPQSANMGKRGCLNRILKLIEEIEA